MKSNYKKKDPGPELDPLLLERIRGSGSVPKRYGSGTLQAPRPLKRANIGPPDPYTIPDD